jgi:hypothetical protein
VGADNWDLTRIFYEDGHSVRNDGIRISKLPAAGAAAATGNSGSADESGGNCGDASRRDESSERRIDRQSGFEDG